MEGYTLPSTSAVQGILGVIFNEKSTQKHQALCFPLPLLVQSATGGSGSWAGGPWRLRGQGVYPVLLLEHSRACQARSTAGSGPVEQNGRRFRPANLGVCVAGQQVTHPSPP